MKAVLLKLVSQNYKVTKVLFNEKLGVCEHIKKDRQNRLEDGCLKF